MAILYCYKYAEHPTSVFSSTQEGKVCTPTVCRVMSLEVIVSMSNITICMWYFAYSHIVTKTITTRWLFSSAINVLNMQSQYSVALCKARCAHLRFAEWWHSCEHEQYHMVASLDIACIVILSMGTVILSDNILILGHCGVPCLLSQCVILSMLLCGCAHAHNHIWCLARVRAIHHMWSRTLHERWPFLTSNLAMFPLLQYAIPTTIHTRGHNIKFICSKGVYKHSFLPVTLRAWNALPQAAVEADTLNQFKASLPGATN